MILTTPINSHRTSAGILLYRVSSVKSLQSGKGLELYLVHPGGPYFRNKQQGHWGVPKGEIDEGESFLQTAQREFTEETGIPFPSGPLTKLGWIVQKGGKHVWCWAVEWQNREIPPVSSNQIEIEWPPETGKLLKIPEVDDGRFFAYDEAKKWVKPTQTPFFKRLKRSLTSRIS